MYQLIYISSATHQISKAEFEELAAHALKKNTEMGITGTLAFKDGNFMQVIEGEQEAIAHLFAQIKEDSRHTLVSIIQEGSISAREYGGWISSFYDSEEGGMRVCRLNVDGNSRK